MQFATLQRARTPRAECPEHGVKTMRVPWAAPGGRFTLLTDLDGGRVLDLEEERTREAARAVWMSSSPEQKGSVKAVAVDMWEPIVETIQQEVPQADIVHDRYPVSASLNKAVDKVRRQEHRELLADGDDTLTGTRQLWLYNPENLRPEQAGEFERLRELNLKAARAWAAKELFSKFWEYASEGWRAGSSRIGLAG